MSFLFFPKAIYPKVSKMPQNTTNTIWSPLTWTISSLRQASGIFRLQIVYAQSCFTNDDGHFSLVSNHQQERLIYIWHRAVLMQSKFINSGIWSLAISESRKIMTAWSGALHMKKSHCRNTMLRWWTHFYASVSPFVNNVPLTVVGWWKWYLKLFFNF